MGPHERTSSALKCARMVDDVGLGQVRKRGDEPTAAHTLCNLVDRRHGRSSTAITSNIDLSQWGRYLGDAVVTASILDGLAMHAIRIDVDGPSFRQHIAAGRDPERKKTLPRATTSPSDGAP